MRPVNRVLCGLGLGLVAFLAGGQSQPANNPAPPPAEMAALVKQQFGPTFTVPPKFPTPLITADFDGDGVEDAVIVASSSEPFPDSIAFKYKVVDPYNAYFGMGDPRVSTSFKVPDPRRDYSLVVIFGAGPEAWRSATPKAKFVVVNLPFDTIEVGRMLLKKKKAPIFVIKARESEIMDSAVYWDGKKWKWEPGGTGN